MDKIYITGHRNPDLDSVCAAAALQDLRSKTDPENEYVAVRCGHLSQNIKHLLSQLGITAPPYMRDVYPKVSDVMLTESRRLLSDEPLSDLSRTFSVENPSAMPVYQHGKYLGLLTIDDIASWFMKAIHDGNTAKRIPMIGEVLGSQGTPLETNVRFEEAKQRLAESNHRGLAVLNGGSYVGFVTRRCFLKKPAYKVIMVDHNEPAQSISGIETANVVEIIDHHRLDSVRTSLPIFMDVEPLGSTCTIVYQNYLRNRLLPPEPIAKILLTGIIADTLILKSPTTTETDVRSAGALAALLQVSVEAYGARMFSEMQALTTRDPKEALTSDFKVYRERGVTVGISQCETTTLGNLRDYERHFLDTIEDVRSENKLDWMLVMITDVLHEHSVLITSAFRSTRHLPYQAVNDRVFDMPGVMSRKKQLLPEVLHAISIDYSV